MYQTRFFRRRAGLAALFILAVPPFASAAPMLAASSGGIGWGYIALGVGAFLLLSGKA